MHNLPHLVSNCLHEQLFCRDALFSLCHAQALDEVMQVEALCEYLQLHTAIAAQAAAVLGAAEDY